MIAFACAHCGKGLRATEELAGKKAKCPQCGKVSPVPSGAASPVTHGSVSANAAVEAKTPPPPTAVAPSAHDAVTLPPDEAAAAAAPGQAKDSLGDTLPGFGNAPASALPATITCPAEWTRFLGPAEAPGEVGRLGGYRVLTILGAGGMGIVFKAEDPRLKRLVALKAMLPGLALTEAARKRFHREAQAAAAIDHDHIVHIYQVDEDRGVPFIAMQFLQGEPLDARLKREGALPIADVLRIGRETAEGLAAAHARGLIHRDIKPANIWLEVRGAQSAEREAQSGARSALRASRSPRVKILDFGLARTVASDTQLTLQGAILGTPAYMAPEQASGDTVDSRCDLFSLGCVLYRMCTNDMPFKGGDPVAVLMAVATEKPKSPRELNSSLPQGLSDLIMQLLEKNPARRPASASDVTHALEMLEADGTAELPGGSAAVILPGAPRGVVPYRWVAAGAGLALLALSLFFILRGRDTQDGRRQADPHKTDWISLFNGKDLSGWKKHPEQTRGHWQVTADGILEGRGGANYLFSERGDYENFHLRVEAKISMGTNAGLFIRSPFGLDFDLRALGGQGKMPEGYEIEIVSPATDPDVPTGSIWRLTPKPNVTKAGGSAMEDDGWFVLETIAQGPRVVTRVNNHPAAERVDSAFKNGHIVLQVLSDPGIMQVRKIEIKELPAVLPEDVSPAGPCPADALKRANIPLELLKAAGDGDAERAPRELVAIFRPLDAERFAVAAVSPDGKWLALGSGTANPPWVSQVDLATGREHRRLVFTGQDKRSVAELVFSPDSKRLVGSTSGGAVRVWAVDRNAALEKRRLTPDRPGSYTLAFSPDNKTLALAQRGAVEPVRLLDLSTPSFEERNLQFAENVTALAFSPDGQTLVCGTASAGKVAATLTFWDVTTGKKKRAPIRDLTNTVVRVQFLPDGKKLAYASTATPECFIVELASGKVEKLDGPAGGTGTFDVGPRGAVAVAAHKDSQIFIHDPAETSVRRLNVGPADIVLREVRFTPEGRHIVTANSDGSVYVLRLAPPAAEAVVGIKE